MTDQIISEIAQDSYGKLIARLVVRGIAISDAEDALGAAFLQALTVWKQQGVPEFPLAWLAKVALRAWLDCKRRDKRWEVIESEIVTELSSSSQERSELCDDRIKIMMGLAHPAIDCSMHAPLMLQVVLGLDATRIGDAFLVAPSTMAQRLVRAKEKIRRSGIPFNCDGTSNRNDRIAAIMEAIYTSFNSSFQASDAISLESRAIVNEAVQLARILVDASPDEPEPKGLLALMLFVDARSDTRHDENGRFVPWIVKISEAGTFERSQKRTHCCGKPKRKEPSAAINWKLRFNPHRRIEYGRDMSIGGRSMHFTQHSFRFTRPLEP